MPFIWAVQKFLRSVQMFSAKDWPRPQHCVKTISLSLCVCLNQRVLSQPVTISEGAMNWQALLLKQSQFLNKQVVRTAHVMSLAVWINFIWPFRITHCSGLLYVVLYVAETHRPLKLQNVCVVRCCAVVCHGTGFLIIVFQCIIIGLIIVVCENGKSVLQEKEVKRQGKCGGWKDPRLMLMLVCVGSDRWPVSLMIVCVRAHWQWSAH